MVSVVLKAGCSSPDSAPHFLPQTNRINVLKSNLVGLRVKLTGGLSLLKVSHVWLKGSSNGLFFYTRRSDFRSHGGGSPFQCQPTAGIYRSRCFNTYTLLDQNTTRYKKRIERNTSTGALSCPTGVKGFTKKASSTWQKSVISHFQVQLHKLSGITSVSDVLPMLSILNFIDIGN